MEVNMKYGLRFMTVPQTVVRLGWAHSLLFIFLRL